MDLAPVFNEFNRFLRYVAPAGVGLGAAFLLDEDHDVIKRALTGVWWLDLVGVFVLGLLLYAVYNASPLRWWFEGTGLRWGKRAKSRYGNVPSETTGVEMSIARWEGRHSERTTQRGVESALEEWFSGVHFLYVSGLSVATVPAVLNWSFKDAMPAERVWLAVGIGVVFMLCAHCHGCRAWERACVLTKRAWDSEASVRPGP
jgi:hypothetical protein